MIHGPRSQGGSSEGKQGRAAVDDAPQRARVLLVDDRPENLLALEAALDPLGVRLVRAGSSEDALRAVQTDEFAVILLDVQLPQMDGYEVAQRIKELEEPRLTPIIFVTALDHDRRHLHAGYESGAVDYLFKPLDPEVLRAKVHAFVRLYEEREAEAFRQRRRYADLADETVAARAERILEGITDAFYALDSEFRFTYLNHRAEEWWGRSSDQLLGRQYWTEFPQAVGSDVYFMHLQAMAERRHLRFEAVAPIAGRWIEASLHPDADGGLSCYFRDISDRKRAEVERERLLSEAEAANRVKSEFLATMSHELRTPLNAMIGYADLLDAELAGPLTGQQRVYLGRLRASALHLLGLVSEVLDLARTDAGQGKVARESAMTGNAVAPALALAAPQAAARGVTLIDERSGDVGEPYVGDPGRVRQILVNLLGNAVKFTEPGGQVTIECGHASERPGSPDALPGPWTYVRVTDTGIGIPVAEQREIFEPFRQLEGGLTRTRGGTGLGLTISRRFARLMGGDLTVDSVPGSGSTFTLWLPAGDEANHEPALLAMPRAVPTPIDEGLVGVREAGGWLRQELERVLANYATRLRSDPRTPSARAMQPAELEDHQASLLGDLAQSLIIIGETGPDAIDLMRDGSAIQHVVAEHHGRRRHRQGWTEDALQRDCEILQQEVEQAIRLHAPPGDEEALRVLLGLLDRAQKVALATWREEELRERRAG